MKPSENSVIGEPSPFVRESKGLDGAVLLDIQQGICFSLNPVGARIWDMLKQGKSFDQITDSLITDFNVPRERVRADVLEFTDHLTQHGLLLSPADTSAKRNHLVSSLIRRLTSISMLC